MTNNVKKKRYQDIVKVKKVNGLMDMCGVDGGRISNEQMSHMWQQQHKI